MQGLLQVMSIFASFTRVLFLIPVWLRGACVQCGVGLRGTHAFFVGLLFSTRVMGGVVALGEDMIKGFREVKEVRGG